jgi:hypothetical protein
MFLSSAAKLQQNAHKNPTTQALKILMPPMEQQLRLSAARGNSNMIFHVPNMLPGIPMFNRHEVILELHNILKNAGYTVTAKYNIGELHVSWQGDSDMLDVIIMT